MTRRALPTRRPGGTMRAAWGQHVCAVTCSVDPKAGAVAEVFYSDGMKSGTDLQRTVQDACIAISIALQHGATVAELLKSLGPEPDPSGQMRPASPVSAVVAALAEFEARLAAGTWPES